MATLAPHLSWHPTGICEEERFWLEERRKSVRGNDRVPGREEPPKLRGSTKSRKEPVRPRAGKYRVHHRLRQHRSHLRRRRMTDCGCVWTTELSIKPRWRTDILSHWSRRCSTGPQECLSPNPNQGRRQVQNRGTGTESCRSGWRTHQLPYNQATIPIRGDMSSAEQRRLKRGMTLPAVPEWRTRVHLMTEVQRR